MSVLDNRFAGWFETVELDLASERLSALRGAAESLGATLDPQGVLDLVAYAAGQPSRSAFESVSAAVTAKDDSFTAVAGDLEPRLVAAAAVARLLEGSGTGAAVAAEAVLSAEFAAIEFPLEELPALARASLADRLRSVRDNGGATPAEFGATFDQLRSAGSEAKTPEARIGLVRGATEHLAFQVASALAALEQRFQTRLDAADEELDILWWAFGASTGEERSRWGSPDAAETLVRTGVELAGYHRFHAEVPSALAILRRILGPAAEEEYPLSDVVSAAAELVELGAAKPGPLLPILTSCTEFLAFRDAEVVTFQAEDSWIASVGRYGVDPTIRRRGDEIAAQTARELLLARAVS